MSKSSELLYLQHQKNIQFINRLPEGAEVLLDYTNWRGVRGVRRVRNVGNLCFYGATAHHPVVGWLWTAHDCEKGDLRTYALDCVHSVIPPAPAPAPAPAKPASEAPAPAQATAQAPAPTAQGDWGAYAPWRSNVEYKTVCETAQWHVKPSEAQQTVRVLQDMLVASHRMRDDLQRDYSAKVAEIESVRQLLAEVQEAHAKLLQGDQSLNNQIDDLRSQVEAKAAVNLSLNKRIDAQQATITAMQEDNRRLTADLTALRNAHTMLVEGRVPFYQAAGPLRAYVQSKPALGDTAIVTATASQLLRTEKVV